jgi:hypothetical protein
MNHCVWCNLAGDNRKVRVYWIVQKHLKKPYRACKDHTEFLVEFRGATYHDTKKEAVLQQIKNNLFGDTNENKSNTVTT